MSYLYSGNFSSFMSTVCKLNKRKRFYEISNFKVQTFSKSNLFELDSIGQGSRSTKYCYEVYHCETIYDTVTQYQSYLLKAEINWQEIRSLPAHLINQKHASSLYSTLATKHNRSFHPIKWASVDTFFPRKWREESQPLLLFQLISSLFPIECT